jgi:hypothetical protein
MATAPREVDPIGSRVHWLCTADDPWVRYRTRTQLLGLPETDAAVVGDRQAMLTHPKLRRLIADAAVWPGGVLKRHNDAGHLLHQLAVLADLGMRADDPGMEPVIRAILAHQSTAGTFQSLILTPRAFGGTDEPTLSWMLCDTPTILYALLTFGLGDLPAVQNAVDHLVQLVRPTGWPCAAGQECGSFRGPGRKDDPCPYANLITLKALARVPQLHTHPAVRTGTEMLLGHWEQRRKRKIRMFGIGTDFCKLKYPFIWYDILHVADTLSHFTWVWDDARFTEMIETIVHKADACGRYTPESVWMAWNDWDFGQKRQPSPWITLLITQMLQRIGRKARFDV